MNFDIRAAAREKMFIVAHRGTPGGNIPCNTIASYEIPLDQGADMIEIDVDMTRDGVLIIFQPSMEKAHLDVDYRLSDMTWEQVSKLRFVNIDNVPTQFGICKFDDFLEHFKGRCFININNFWEHPQEIYETLRAHNMIDQVVIKSTVSDDVLTVLSTLAPELPFISVVSQTHHFHDALMHMNINYVGVEVLFNDENMEVASPQFIERMHRDAKLVWVNSIVYNVKKQLTAGHSDDTALTESKDKGWGWLADRGFDIIKTDCPMMFINYLKSVGKYEKR